MKLRLLEYSRKNDFVNLPDAEQNKVILKWLQDPTKSGFKSEQLGRIQGLISPIIIPYIKSLREYPEKSDELFTILHQLQGNLPRNSNITEKFEILIEALNKWLDLKYDEGALGILTEPDIYKLSMTEYRYVLNIMHALYNKDTFTRYFGKHDEQTYEKIVRDILVDTTTNNLRTPGMNSDNPNSIWGKVNEYQAKLGNSNNESSASNSSNQSILSLRWTSELQNLIDLLRECGIQFDDEYEDKDLLSMFYHKRFRNTDLDVADQGNCYYIMNELAKKYNLDLNNVDNIDMLYAGLARLNEKIKRNRR